MSHLFFIPMKKQTLISSVIFLALHFTVCIVCHAQKGPTNPEIAKWQSEQDEKSFWEFKNDGKLYSTYTGRDHVTTYRYSISTTPPPCQEGVSLAIEKNVKFLQLTHEKYGNVSCFYIYALNSERMAVMDAQTGHIFPMIKADN